MWRGLRWTACFCSHNDTNSDGNNVNTNHLFKLVYLGIGIIALFRAIQQAQAGAFGWGTLSLAIAFFCVYRFYITGKAGS